MSRSQGKRLAWNGGIEFGNVNAWNNRRGSQLANVGILCNTSNASYDIGGLQDGLRRSLQVSPNCNLERVIRPRTLNKSSAFTC